MLTQMAQAMGKGEDARLFYEKGQAYHHIFDQEKGWFRPRKADGSWVAWPENARLKEWYGCIEANSYQQGWFVPHDVSGMVTNRCILLLSSLISLLYLGIPRSGHVIFVKKRMLIK